LHPGNISINTTAHSKTAVLLKVSQLLNLNYPELLVNVLFDAFLKRENMGSTAIGHGIIIPHIRSDFISKTCACVLKLQSPVDFGAMDKQPVDLVLALVVPQHEADQHLQTLSDIIIQFSPPEFRHACRRVNNSGELYKLLTAKPAAATNQLETQ